MSLPKWKSHKVVEAFKISKIKVRQDGSAEMSSKNGDRVVVDRDYRMKHYPITDGYYVRDEDGYESWSPAKAFEDDGYYVRDEDGCESWSPAKAFKDGYTRIEVTDE